MTSNAWAEIIVQCLEGRNSVDGDSDVGAILGDVWAFTHEPKA